MATFAEKKADEFFAIVRPVLEWKQVQDVHLVRYEEIMGDKGETVAQQAVDGLIRHVLGPKAGERSVSLEVIKHKQTLTASGNRTSWRSWWSERTEAVFRRERGDEFNRLLGY